LRNQRRRNAAAVPRAEITVAGPAVKEMRALRRFLPKYEKTRPRRRPGAGLHWQV